MNVPPVTVVDTIFRCAKIDMRAFHRLHHFYGIAFKRGRECNSSWHFDLPLNVSRLSYILRIRIAMSVCAQRRSIPYIAHAAEKNQPAYSSAPVDTGPCTLYGDSWPRPGCFGERCGMFLYSLHAGAGHGTNPVMAIMFNCFNFHLFKFWL